MLNAVFSINNLLFRYDFNQIIDKKEDLEQKFGLVVDSLMFLKNTPRCFSALRYAYMIEFANH